MLLAVAVEESVDVAEELGETRPVVDALPLLDPDELAVPDHVWLAVLLPVPEEGPVALAVSEASALLLPDPVEVAVPLAVLDHD